MSTSNARSHQSARRSLTVEEPAQERENPLPVMPTPANQMSTEVTTITVPIAEPKAAKPRKAGAAKGKADGAHAKDAKAKDAKAKDAKSKKPKAAAAKAGARMAKSSKRKGKDGRAA